MSTPLVHVVSPPVLVEQSNQYQNLPCGQMMSRSDVRFVVRKVLEPIESIDPYSDDFYFVQRSFRIHKKLTDDAQAANLPPPPPFIGPLPLWKETKMRIQEQLRLAKNSLELSSREWEEKEKVLGHTQRSNIYKPRELLSTKRIWDVNEDAEEALHRFSSRVWTLRQSIQKGYEAFYAVQELDRLCQTPAVMRDKAVSEEILHQIERAMSVLSQALGIRDTTGVLTGDVLIVGGSDISLDLALIASLLKYYKGKKLFKRCLHLLPPEHRWALFPHILAAILQSDFSTQSKEMQDVDQGLLKQLLEFVREAHHFQKQQQAMFEATQEKLPTGDSSAAPFTLVLLGHLRQCVKNVMIVHMEKKTLRLALLSDRLRAEVLHGIVSVGDELAQLTDASVREEWTHIKDAFMSLLD